MNAATFVLLNEVTEVAMVYFLNISAPMCFVTDKTRKFLGFHNTQRFVLMFKKVD